MTQAQHNEQRFKRARRWFRIFLVLSILGVVDAMPIETGYDTDLGPISLGLLLIFGGLVAVIFSFVVSGLTLLWIIFAILARREMNKLRRAQQQGTA